MSKNSTNMSMFMLFLINMILPVTTCVLACLGCYTMAGWCLVGAILCMSTPSGVIHTDTPEEMEKILKAKKETETHFTSLEKRVKELEDEIANLRSLQ